MYCCDVKLWEGGELLVKGPVVFKGYLSDPEATSKAPDEVYVVEELLRAGLSKVSRAGLRQLLDEVRAGRQRSSPHS